MVHLKDNDELVRIIPLRVVREVVPVGLCCGDNNQYGDYES